MHLQHTHFIRRPELVCGLRVVLGRPGREEAVVHDLGGVGGGGRGRRGRGRRGHATSARTRGAARTPVRHAREVVVPEAEQEDGRKRCGEIYSRLSMQSIIHEIYVSYM